MRILISADIEGVANVFHPEQTRAGNPEYERARRWMTAEADAAVRGAFEGGATEVIVNDSHGGFRNLVPDWMDPRARFVLGKPRYLGMMAGVEGCDAVCMIGYHARAGSRGTLAHTINSFAFARVWLNEQELGEAGLYGALAGERGVPVAVASGDDVFVRETLPLLPHTTFVETKQAEGMNAGMSFSSERACDAILAAVRGAVQRGHFGMPLRIKPPIVCRLQTQTPALADLFCQWPALERVDGTMLRFAADSVEHAVRMLNSLSAMSFMLR
ncbi:M55 family metallopeptidase [Ralstonia syzygii]|uniref:D-amino peptidase, DppA family n=1 Tax=Ralstonia syzygii R24 TaxID=907261 RepID=G2ZZ11_9RALS|nr:M55 family metallopeptidase [Ralstonia syzygii]CCA84100.1 D-amino peptidase, DppA family [Ralstonia syzygii R24]